MALTVDNGTSTEQELKLTVKQYPNGKVLFVAPNGSVNAKDNIIGCGPKKIAKLFGNDKDGDNVLYGIYQFLKSTLNDREMEAVNQGLHQFIELWQPGE